MVGKREDEQIGLRVNLGTGKTSQLLQSQVLTFPKERQLSLENIHNSGQVCSEKSKLRGGENISSRSVSDFISERRGVKILKNDQLVTSRP